MNIEAESYIPSFMLQRVTDINKIASSKTEKREHHQEHLAKANSNNNSNVTTFITKTSNDVMQNTPNQQPHDDSRTNSKTQQNTVVSTRKVKKAKAKKNDKRSGGKRITYSKAELLALQNSPAVNNLIYHDIMVQVEPHGLLPLRFARLLDSCTALEYLNMEGVQQTIACTTTSAQDKVEPHITSSNATKERNNTNKFSFQSALEVKAKTTSSVEEELLPLLLSIQTTHTKENIEQNMKTESREQPYNTRWVEAEKMLLSSSSTERCLAGLSNTNNTLTKPAEVFQRICNSYLVLSNSDKKEILSSSSSESLAATKEQQQEKLMESLRNYRCSECGPHNTTFTSSVIGDSHFEEEHTNNAHEITTSQPVGCNAMHRLMNCIHKEIVSTRAGRCMMQGGEVVWGMLQLALVFEHKQSSMRMRQLAEKSPAIVKQIGEFMFGTGYYMPLPAITDHDAWSALIHLLCFDAIRDNCTRVVTDLSRHWRRRTTAFEQFVYFYAFRDDRPRSRVRNMITRSVKPGMVAMLSGDVVAMTLLHYLGFYTPHDYYWQVYPFLQQALGHSATHYDVIRHLGHYLSCKQDKNLYNPLGLPFVNETAKQ